MRRRTFNHFALTRARILNAFHAAWTARTPSRRDLRWRAEAQRRALAGRS